MHDLMSSIAEPTACESDIESEIFEAAKTASIVGCPKCRAHENIVIYCETNVQTKAATYFVKCENCKTKSKQDNGFPAPDSPIKACYWWGVQVLRLNAKVSASGTLGMTGKAQVEVQMPNVRAK